MARDLNEDHSEAEYMNFQRSAAWRTADLKVRRVEVHQEQD